ncbi:MAG: MBL fold metallo-hydrolase [Candidatus Micrarchaeota archaeon]
MKLTVLGSGGALTFPRPCCDCANCHEAKSKGIPYSRTGPSLFLHDDAVLFDSPEETTAQLLREGIPRVKSVFYTHWHPDHVQGWRSFQHMQTQVDERNKFEFKNKWPPIDVFIAKDAWHEFEIYHEPFEYLQKLKVIKINFFEDRKPIKLGKITVTPLNLKTPVSIGYAFLIGDGKHKAIYAPCEVFGLKPDSYFKNLDLFLVEAGWVGDAEKVRRETRNPTWEQHYSLDETFELAKRVGAKKTILTHLSGLWHESWSDFKKYLAEYKKKHGVDTAELAFDGMKVELK